MFDLYHETSFENVSKILESFELLKSSNIPKHIKRGQGTANRKLTSDPMISLTDPEFYNDYDEVDAVFLRLKHFNHNDILRYNDCALIMNSHLLYTYDNVINTEENFGFMISENGKEGESQFSGDPGISIFNMQDIEILNTYKFDHYRSEVAVLSNISLKFLKKILMKKKFLGKVETSGINPLCVSNKIPIEFI